MSSMVVPTLTERLHVAGLSVPGVASPTSTRRRFRHRRAPACQRPSRFARGSWRAGARAYPSVGEDGGARRRDQLRGDAVVVDRESARSIPSSRARAPEAGRARCSTVPPPSRKRRDARGPRPSASSPRHRLRPRRRGYRDRPPRGSAPRRPGHGARALGLGEPLEHRSRAGLDGVRQGRAASMGRSMSPRVWKRRAGSVRTARCVPRSPPRSTGARLEPPALDGEAPERRPRASPSWQPGVHEGAGDHVPARAGGAVEVRDPHPRHPVSVRSRRLEAPVERPRRGAVGPPGRDGAAERRADVARLSIRSARTPSDSARRTKSTRGIVEVHGDVAVGLGRRSPSSRGSAASRMPVRGELFRITERDAPRR